MPNIDTVSPIPTFMSATTAASARTAIGIYLTQTSTQTITLSGAYSLAFTMTGNTNVTLPTSGTLLSSSSKISDLASTTSAELAGKISDETGSGALVFATSPTFVTPVLGAATATSINGLTVTSSTGTLSITNGKTVAVTNSVTIAGTDGTTITLPASTSTLYGTASVSITSAQLKESMLDETGTGQLVFGNTPTIITPVITSGTITTGLTPTTNDGAALGTTSLSFSDLFLASGAVLNFNAGNAVLTHSSGILTVSTGDLRVTTAGTNSASAVTVGGTQTLTNKTLNTASLSSCAISDGTIVDAVITGSSVRPPATSYPSNGAISLDSGIHVITKNTAAAAMTVAAPTVAQNGERLTIMSSTLWAHVITFTGTTLFDGTAGANSTVTFAALAGASVTVVAWEATWLLESSVAATIAP